jgi:hypothetical protein
LTIPKQKDRLALPMSTPLYSDLQTLDLADRLAKSVARKSGLPTYVGNSVSFFSAGRGGDVEEELESFKKIVAVTLATVADVPSV